MSVSINNPDPAETPLEQERRIISNRRSGIDRRKVRMRFTGLDIDKGIDRYNGDRDIYFRILKSYMIHTRALLDSIATVTEDSLCDYAATMRNIKGSCRMIYADMICSAADSLEKAAEDGDFIYVSTHNKTFIDASWKLIFDLEDMLSNINTGAAKPIREFPDINTLSELMRGCREYNMDTVDGAMADMEKYIYTADEGLTDWLIDNIKLMNFTQIIDRLTPLAGEGAENE